MVRNVESQARTRVISLPAHILQPNLSALDRQIDQALLDRPESVALDLAGLQSIDSAGLNWLLNAQSRLSAQGIGMILHSPSALFTDIMVATRLDHRFQVIAAAATEGNNA